MWSVTEANTLAVLRGEAGLGSSLLFFSVICFRIGSLKPLSHWRNVSHCRNKMFLILASDFSTCRISRWCRGRDLHLILGPGMYLCWTVLDWCEFTSCSVLSLLPSIMEAVLLTLRGSSTLCAPTSPRELWDSHSASTRFPNILN